MTATQKDRAALARRLRPWVRALDQEQRPINVDALGPLFRDHGYKPPRWVTSGCFRCHNVTMNKWCDERGIARRGADELMQPFLARLLRWCVARLEGGVDE